MSDFLNEHCLKHLILKNIANVSRDYYHLNEMVGNQQHSTQSFPSLFYKNTDSDESPPVVIHAGNTDDLPLPNISKLLSNCPQQSRGFLIIHSFHSNNQIKSKYLNKTNHIKGNNQEEVSLKEFLVHLQEQLQRPTNQFIFDQLL